MNTITSILIDKYLKWYESLSNKFQTYKSQKVRLEKLHKAVKYLEIRWKGKNFVGAYQAGLLPSEKVRFSFTLWDSLRKEATAIDLEINELRQYFEHDLFYMPTEKDWEVLHYYRAKELAEARNRFADLLSRTVLNEKEQAKNELNTINATIQESPFYENVTDAKPLFKNVVEGVSKELGNTVSGWFSFLIWVHYIDYSNWLNAFITGTEIDITTYPKTAPLLKWEAPVNVLYTLFYELLEGKVITWNGKTNEGDKMEIARMLANNFVNKEGEPLSIEMIKQTLKPGTPKAKKKIDISNLVLSLNHLKQKR